MLIYGLGFEIPDVGKFICSFIILGFEIPDVGIFICSFLVIGF